jgi:hypothetical protein
MRREIMDERNRKREKKKRSCIEKVRYGIFRKVCDG